MAININKKEQNAFIEKKNKLIFKLEELINNCFIQYFSILVKVIGDQNIKKLILKCESLDCIKNYIYINNFFTDDNLLCIFNFINHIHNNSEYKKYAFNFMRIFENDMSEKEKKFYNFGLRLIKLLKKRKDFLKIIIVLLYNNMNTSLTTLEERFCEYKFKPKSNLNNQVNSNIHRNNNNDNAIDNNNLDLEPNVPNNLLFGIEFRARINFNNFINNPFIIFRRINNAHLTDKEKLALLEESFKDTNNQFIKLTNFYTIASDIPELYHMNSFENKFLNNLLLSLYNILFSPNNISKLIDNKSNKINPTYKKLLDNINEFYNILIDNFIQQKNDNLLKEISQQRNLYHLKDILKIFEKFNSPTNEMENDKYIVLKTFISMIEKIVPEEQTIKLNNNYIENNGKEGIRSGTKVENNICPMCADSVVDTHILPCGHSICRNCLFHYLSENKVCPFCRVEIKGIKEDPNFKI